MSEIKIHKKIRYWYGFGNPNRLALWVHILINASQEEKDYVFCGKRIVLRRGQFITGRKRLATDVGISESYVEKLLTEFEAQGMLEQQKSHRSRLITVTCYDDYQTSDTKKKVSSGSPASSLSRALRKRFEEIWAQYPKKAGKPQAYEYFKKSVKTDKDWQEINRALANYKAVLEREAFRHPKDGQGWFNPTFWKGFVDISDPDPREDFKQFCKERSNSGTVVGISTEVPGDVSHGHI